MAVLFFVAYIVVARLFVMNLFVGFIVDGFNTNQGKSAVPDPAHIDHQIDHRVDQIDHQIDHQIVYRVTLRGLHHRRLQHQPGQVRGTPPPNTRVAIVLPTHHDLGSTTHPSRLAQELPTPHDKAATPFPRLPTHSSCPRLPTPQPTGYLSVGFIVDGFNTNQGKSAVLPPCSH